MALINRTMTTMVRILGYDAQMIMSAPTWLGRLVLHTVHSSVHRPMREESAASQKRSPTGGVTHILVPSVQCVISSVSLKYMSFRIFVETLSLT